MRKSTATKQIVSHGPAVPALDHASMIRLNNLVEKSFIGLLGA
jgi:hypothetical protein